MRPIDADALLLPDENSDKVLVLGRRGGKTLSLAYELMKKKIQDAPTLEVEPVVHACWQPYYDVVNGNVYPSTSKHVCSACKDIWESSRWLPRCPSCGAIMDSLFMKKETE